MFGIGGIVVIVMAWIGGNYLRQPAPIALTPLPAGRPRPMSSAAPLPPTEVIVHVAGAVNRPTVVHLHPGDRVHDAIRLAGGAKPYADLDSINLAAKLEDGTQIFVPRKDGESRTESSKSYRGGAKTANRYSTKPRKGAAKSTGPVNLNTGTLADFDSLPGIGPAIAQRILDYRRAHGGFTSIDELLAVPGFGTAKLNQIRDRLRL